MVWVIVPIGLIAAGLGCYKFGYINALQLHKDLSEAHEFNSISELEERAKLSGHNNNHPVYAYIKGVVECDDPIPCEFSRDMDGKPLKAAVYNKSLYRKYEMWSNISKRWLLAEQKLANYTKVSPFYLSDHNSNRIAVNASLDHIPVFTVYENFQPSDQATSTVAYVFEKLLSSSRELGLRTEETALPVGTALYAVGDAFYDSTVRSLVIKVPADNKPFLLSKTSLSVLRQRGEKFAAYFWWASAVLVFMGASFVVYKGYQQWKQRQVERNFVISDETRVCCVCLNQESKVAFLPCGHVCTCNNCSPLVTNCPVCRTHINSKHTVVFS